ncbi:unnamed protein product [Amoebophrya sp. A25]|nr:unnamed protein product [Amoebophrya sp. A25]|eukprot:GSA25T00020940001.1
MQSHAQVQPSAGPGAAGIVVGRPVGQIGQGVDAPYGEGATLGSPVNGTTTQQHASVAPMQPLAGGGGGTLPGQYGYGRPSGGGPNRVMMLQQGGGRPPVMMVIVDSGNTEYRPDPRIGGPFSGGHMINASGNLETLENVYPPTLLAVVTCFCCFFPGGICACISLLKCQEGHAAIARQDTEGARRAKEDAMRWIYASWMATVFFMIFYSFR